jgi:hypothetical protein
LNLKKYSFYLHFYLSLRCRCYDDCLNPIESRFPRVLQIFSKFISKKMVLLHVKKQDESLFYYETATDKKVAQVAEEIIKIENDRLRMTFLLTGNSV